MTGTERGTLLEQITGRSEFREAFHKLLAEAVAVLDRFRFPRNNADLSPAEWEAFLKVEAFVEYHGARERLDEEEEQRRTDADE